MRTPPGQHVQGALAVLVVVRARARPGRHPEAPHVDVAGARGHLRDLGAADDAARGLVVGAGLDEPHCGRVYDSRASRSHLDLQRLLRRGLMVDLQRRVADTEPLGDHALQDAAQLVAVIAGPDDDVRRQRREARGHLPHVQVVDLDHAGVGGQRPADLVGVDAGGRRLHEHPPGLLEQPVGGVQQEGGDEQRGDRVGAIEAGGHDHPRRHRGGDEPVEVGHDVAVGALEVEAALLARSRGPGSPPRPG